jgi:hypothetical protein
VVPLDSVSLMQTSGLVSESLERLIAAGVFTAVLGVHSAAGRDGENVMVGVSSDASAQTRLIIHQALAGLPYQCVDVDRIQRATVEGLIGSKEGSTWRICTQAEVRWIQESTQVGFTITSAIPPVFDSYATVEIPSDDAERRAGDAALLRLLTAQSGAQPWSLGYLDTGVHDVVFDDAPRVTLYAGWHYVLVEAGPFQADIWRDDAPLRGRLPDLIYPADHSWLLSTLWDDDWRSVGGNAALIRALLSEPDVHARTVNPDENATPPGHHAR